MTDINEIKSFYIECARNRLGDYESLSKNALANGYCDAEEKGDEYLKDGYWAALMLRYWSRIYKWETTCQSLGKSREEYVDWLDDCLRDAFFYRSWRKYNIDGTLNPKYQEGDEDAVDKSINFFCGAKRGKEYQFYNKDNRKCNVLTYSIDASVDQNGDSALDDAGLVSDEVKINGVTELIQFYLTKNKNIEALILDGIVNGNSFKEIKRKTSYSNTFNQKKLVKHLNSLDKEFFDNYFSYHYKIDKEKAQSIFNELQVITEKGNGRLYTKIKKTLIEIKDNPSLLSFIM